MNGTHMTSRYQTIITFTEIWNRKSIEPTRWDSHRSVRAGEGEVAQAALAVKHFCCLSRVTPCHFPKVGLALSLPSPSPEHPSFCHQSPSPPPPPPLPELGSAHPDSNVMLQRARRASVRKFKVPPWEQLEPGGVTGGDVRQEVSHFRSPSPP